MLDINLLRVANLEKMLFFSHYVGDFTLLIISFALVSFVISYNPICQLLGLFIPYGIGILQKMPILKKITFL